MRKIVQKIQKGCKMAEMEFLLQIMSSELTNNVFIIDDKIIVQLPDNSVVVLAETK